MSDITDWQFNLLPLLRLYDKKHTLTIHITEKWHNIATEVLSSSPPIRSKETFDEPSSPPAADPKRPSKKALTRANMAIVKKLSTKVEDYRDIVGLYKCSDRQCNNVKFSGQGHVGCLVEDGEHYAILGSHMNEWYALIDKYAGKPDAIALLKEGLPTTIAEKVRKMHKVATRFRSKKATPDTPSPSSTPVSVVQQQAVYQQPPYLYTYPPPPFYPPLY